MIHSLTFGNGLNTFEDFGMMAVERLVFASPEVKTNFVDITGSDNSLDMTEVLTGYPTYSERKGSFKFRFIDNGVPVRGRLTKLMNAVHGKRLTAILSEEPEYYYDVRWSVNDTAYKKVGEFADVELQYIANAYKLEITDTLGDWLWNPFNFETGVIRNYDEITVNGSNTVEVVGSRKPTVPKFIVTGGTLSLSFGTNLYTLPVGTTVIPQIVLMDETYNFIFTGLGTVSIDFRGGSL